MTVPHTAFLHMPSIVLEPTIPGDANLDGKVNVNDLTIVLSNFGQTTNMNWSTGDFNGDGRVDVNDLTIVLAHFGQSVGSGGVAPGARAFHRRYRGRRAVGLGGLRTEESRLEEVLSSARRFLYWRHGFRPVGLEIDGRRGEGSPFGLPVRCSDPPASNVTAAARLGERGEGLLLGLRASE